MTCNDCIHCGVCHCDIYFDSHNRQYQYSTDIENECEAFKDESLYIKLPCKVGDKVYMLAYDCTKGLQFNPFNSNGSSTHGLCLKCDKYPCDIHRAIRERKIRKINIFSDGIDFEWEGYCDFSIKDLGDTVFLTREEAEKALREKDGENG